MAGCFVKKSATKITIYLMIGVMQFAMGTVFLEASPRGYGNQYLAQQERQEQEKQVLERQKQQKYAQEHPEQQKLEQERQDQQKIAAPRRDQKNQNVNHQVQQNSDQEKYNQAQRDKDAADKFRQAKELRWHQQERQREWHEH